MRADTSTELAWQRVEAGGYTFDVHQNGIMPHVPTLLLVHGIGVSSRYFSPFAEALAKDYQVIAMDLPGYGKSPKPDCVLSIKELADVVADFIKKYRISRPILVGHSMGCQIAAHLGWHHPELVSKLILLGPTVNKWERSVLKQGIRLLQDTFGEPLKANSIILHDYLQMGLRRYLKTTQYMIEDHLEESLRACHVPILIVRGEHDKIVPREWAQYLCEQTENCTLKEVSGAPHVVQFKEAKRLKRLCRSFINA